MIKDVDFHVLTIKESLQIWMHIELKANSRDILDF
jgi:hypothetical protein